MTRHDEEIDRLKTEVHCGTVLERLQPPWRIDARGSTKGAIKYRRGPGEVLIVNHGGRGWWDPTDAQAKGDVFHLVQRLEPGLNFGQVRQVLRRLAGIEPSFPEHLRCRRRRSSSIPVEDLWRARPRLAEGMPTWRYLVEARALPATILVHAIRHDLIRRGPAASAWFPHRDHAGRLTGIDMRGPRWRGFSAGGTKSLFRLPGSTMVPTRLAVAEAPIDALSLAALEGPRPDTLYVATTGGMGPGTVAALQALLTEMALRPAGVIAVATDADAGGDRHAAFLHQLADVTGVAAHRFRLPSGIKDWNELLQRAARNVLSRPERSPMSARRAPSGR